MATETKWYQPFTLKEIHYYPGNDQTARFDAQKAVIQSTVNTAPMKILVHDPVAYGAAYAWWQTWHNGDGLPPNPAKYKKLVKFTFAGFFASQYGPISGPKQPNPNPVRTDDTPVGPTTEPPECPPCAPLLLTPDLHPTRAGQPTSEIMPGAASQGIIWHTMWTAPGYTPEKSVTHNSSYTFSAIKVTATSAGTDVWEASCACDGCGCSDLKAPPDAISPGSPLSPDILTCGPGNKCVGIMHYSGTTCGRGAVTFGRGGSCYYCAYDNTSPGNNQPGGPNVPSPF